MASNYSMTDGNLNCKKRRCSSEDDTDSVVRLIPHKPLMKPNTQGDSMFYNMSHKKRGIALIFNHKKFDIPLYEDRPGTDYDCRKLKEALEKLHFDVRVFTDLTYKKIKLAVEDVVKENHQDNDCILVSVLTHGELGCLCAKDTLYKSDFLWQSFSDHNCPSLAGKPRIFFIQACQGDDLDAGITLRNRTAMDGPMWSQYRINTEEHFIICHSTNPGYFSWRNTVNGTWFIQSLVEVLLYHSKDLDILKMLTLVCQAVAYNYESRSKEIGLCNKKQIPCITSMLTKLLVFGDNSTNSDDENCNE